MNDDFVCVYLSNIILFLLFLLLFFLHFLIKLLYYIKKKLQIYIYKNEKRREEKWFHLLL